MTHSRLKQFFHKGRWSTYWEETVSDLRTHDLPFCQLGVIQTGTSWLLGRFNHPWLPKAAKEG